MTKERFDKIIEEIWYNYNYVGMKPAEEIWSYIEKLKKKAKVSNISNSNTNPYDLSKAPGFRKRN